MPNLPTLPVTDALPALCDTLAAGRNAVLVAPPGAGKTTLVPLALLDAPWRGDHRILMLEPRRLATRAAATRMASLLDQPVGRTVGYRTRLDGAGVRRRPGSRSSPRACCCAACNPTPAWRASRRSSSTKSTNARWNPTSALALCLDLQRMLRPDLRLLAMSATADGARLAGLMDADVIESAGRMFPVTIEHFTTRHRPPARTGRSRRPSCPRRAGRT